MGQVFSSVELFSCVRTIRDTLYRSATVLCDERQLESDPDLAPVV
jgi:hypothetical protein